jgi:hypothetical protein
MKFEKNVSSSQVLAELDITNPTIANIQAQVIGTLNGTFYVEFSNDSDFLGWVRNSDLDTTFSAPTVDKVMFDISLVGAKKARLGIEVASGSALIKGIGFAKDSEE